MGEGNSQNCDWRNEQQRKKCEFQNPTIEQISRRQYINIYVPTHYQVSVESQPYGNQRQLKIEKAAVVGAEYAERQHKYRELKQQMSDNPIFAIEK